MVETERELTAGAPAEQLARWSDQIEKARPQEVALPGPGGRRPDDPRGTQGQARKVGREPEPGRGRDGKTEEPRGAPPGHGEERRGTPGALLRASPRGAREPLSGGQAAHPPAAPGRGLGAEGGGGQDPAAVLARRRPGSLSRRNRICYRL